MIALLHGLGGGQLSGPSYAFIAAVIVGCVFLFGIMILFFAWLLGSGTFNRPRGDC